MRGFTLNGFYFEAEENIAGAVEVPLRAPTQAELDVRGNGAALAELARLDAASVRGLREFIIAKFGNDPQLPAQVKTAEQAAAVERGKLK